MKARNGFNWPLLTVITAAMLVAFGSSAGAYDVAEFPLALNALSTYAPGVDPPPNDGAHDFAVGGGQHGGGNVLEGFSAHSGPSGQNPKGHVEITLNPPQPTKLSGNVFCLQVTGNRALILSREVRGPNLGDLILTEVVDNGNPVKGTPPDLIRNSFASNGGIIPPSAGFPCGQPAFAPVPLEKGNIVVRDVT
jgi:hypothetical protein